MSKVHHVDSQTIDRDEFIKVWNNPEHALCDVAAIFGISVLSTSGLASRIRREYGIKLPRKYNRKELDPEIVLLLGKIPDLTIAKKCGVSRERVRQWRAARGIPRCSRSSEVYWPDYYKVVAGIWCLCEKATEVAELVTEIMGKKVPSVSVGRAAKIMGLMPFSEINKVRIVTIANSCDYLYQVREALDHLSRHTVAMKISRYRTEHSCSIKYFPRPPLSQANIDLFIEIFNNSGSTKEVQAKLAKHGVDMSIGTIYSRAYELRKKGYKVKKLKKVN